MNINFQLVAKKIVENVPVPFGYWVPYIPFSWRLGRQYKDSQKEIAKFARLDPDERREYIFERVRNIVRFAFYNNNFYREFYKGKGYDINSLKSFEDISKIPVVKKDDLKQYDLEYRSIIRKGRLMLNTGGSSGEPLTFYVDGGAFAREWAHMHFIWSKLGYRQTDLALTFRGRNLGKKILKFNPLHNEVFVNGYADISEVTSAIRSLCRTKNVAYLHGYPSSIYNYVCYWFKYAPDVIKSLNNSLRGIFFTSEYPAPLYRNTIESAFNIPTISWYGHSEMAIIAYEREKKYDYYPMHTYGYCEAIPNENGDYHLVGTSYDNVVSPFIRYDTGDIVVPEFKDSIVDKFRVESGRVGGFITDLHGNRVSLTALIFGRHHKIFGYARFVQIRQNHPGVATIIITLPNDVDSSIIQREDMLNLTNVSIRFNFEVRSTPVYSPSGKVPLMVL